MGYDHTSFTTTLSPSVIDLYNSRSGNTATNVDGYLGHIDSMFIAEFIYVPALAIGYVLLGLYNLDRHGIITVDFTWGFTIFTESESEISSIEDIELLQQKAMVSSMFYLGLFKVLYTYHKAIGAPIVLSATMLCVTVLALPTTLSLVFGAYVTNYLKGDAEANSVLHAGVFDLTTFLGFFKRFAVQMVRYVLITTKLYLFDKYIYGSIRGTTLGLDLYMERRDIGGLLTHISEDISYYIAYTCEFVGELANIFIVYYAQLGAFMLVLFWLLKALYATAWPIVKIL